MSHWAKVRSFGCFIYFEREVPARALLKEAIEGLGLAADAKISTKNNFLSWKKLSWKTIDAAIASPDTLAISLLVGSPDDVRLGGSITLRLPGKFPELEPPPLTWIGAESARWPERTFTEVSRRLLKIAATHATPLSGGVLAASELRNAKVEMTQEYETFPGDDKDKSQATFRERMRGDRQPEKAFEKIRRVYPITLLGPKFASQVDDSKLAAAGATNIERVNGSVIFDATPKLLEAWSPEYLAATVELQRLLWPLSFQNPADAPKARGVVTR